MIKLFLFCHHISVPIVPDYLYHIQRPKIDLDDTYKFLEKNCSNHEIITRRNFFARHPTQFRYLLRTSCNWTTDWAMERIDLGNQERIFILEKV